MRNRKHILIAIGLLVILGVLAFVMRGHIPPRIDLPFDVSSTGLAAEFASTPMDINTVLGADRRYAEAIQQQQYLDFAFIVCYVALFVILGLALRDYDVPGARLLGWAAIVCAIGAGLFDVAENITILTTASVVTSLTSPVRMFSIPKWALVSLVMVIESVVILFWPRLRLWWRIAAVIVGGLLLFAGCSGLLFSLLVSIPDIAWSAEWMTYALIALLVFLVAEAFLPRSWAGARRLRY